MRTIGVIALAMGLAASPQNQSPVRTGLIVGQVVDGTTNKPVPEAIVTLIASGGAQSRPEISGRRVMSDSDGRFFFADLPAGSYTLRAVKAGYPQGGYGSRQPSFSGTPDPVIPLAEGERRGDATIVLWKYSTLGGTVLDEAGEPFIGVEVRALRRFFSAGTPKFTTVAGASARTDDRGMFRIASLRPGAYILCVASSQTTLPIALFEENLWQRNDEVMAAIPEFQILGYSQNQQIGNVVLMTRSGVAWPPAPSDSGRLDVYPTTFFPSTTSPTDATVFSLGSGDERSAGTIQLKPVPAVRVSGKIVGPNGPAALIALRLVAAGENQPQVALDPVTGLTDRSGSFTLLGVPSGQYVLRVLTPRVTGGPVPPSTTDKPILWAAEPITVGDTDLTDLSVTLRHTFRVTGRVEFRGSKPGPSGDALRECCPVSIDPSGSGISALTSPDANGNFTTGVAGDSYFVTAEGPSEWHLKAVMFDGRDISDEPVTIREDISGIVVVYSDAVSQLSGSVRNAQGAPEAGASVVVFPTDRRRWVGYGSRFPRRVVSTPASPTGAFTVTALPPGDYFVAAISDSLLDTWRDPKVLEALSRTAVRMSLAENEKKSVNLTTERSR